MAYTSTSEVRATDVLANERTFLAWIRTALALAGFGFVIARFALFTREFLLITHSTLPENGLSAGLGGSMVVAGIVTAVYGSYRYVETARGLREGRVVALTERAAIVAGLFVTSVAIVVALDLFVIR